MVFNDYSHYYGHLQVFSMGIKQQCLNSVLLPGDAIDYVSYYLIPLWKSSLLALWYLDSQKFSRHAGLDPASSFSIQLKIFWIPALGFAAAGMTAFFYDY